MSYVIVALQVATLYGIGRLKVKLDDLLARHSADKQEILDAVAAERQQVAEAIAHFEELLLNQEIPEDKAAALFTGLQEIKDAVPGVFTPSDGGGEGEGEGDGGSAPSARRR